MAVWNPTQYELFQWQRQRPAEDLMQAMLWWCDRTPPPRLVFDLGCGTGSIARRLDAQWPEVEVIGIDSSAEMLERARALGGSWTNVTWVQGDIGTWQADRPADVIVSNAALHWLDRHEERFPQWMRMLAPGGLLAVQMPRNFDRPSHTLLADTIRDGPWAGPLADALGPAPVHEPTAYLDWLSPLTTRLELWETEYLHVLPGEDAVLEWVKGTLLVPALARLPPEEAAEFLACYRERLRDAYPQRPDGTTLFPFRRLFILAQA